MKNILKASIFKLFKDKTFRVTLIVGGVLAIVLSLLYFSINQSSGGKANIGSGGYMLVTSFTPTTNFGLAIPINLIILIIGEFTFGTIRNKVIVGYRKSYIYFSLFIVGLIFTACLLLLYTGLSVILGCLINGGWGNVISGEDAAKFILVGLIAYLFVTSLTLFFASLTRHQGAAIGLTVFVLMVCMIGALAGVATANTEEAIKLNMWINPLFIESMTTIGGVLPFPVHDILQGDFLAAAIVSPLIYGAIFYFLGSYIFSHRDLK